MPERRPRADRAQQFMPFAALKGYYDLIRERERVVESKRELTDEQALELSQRLAGLERREMASIVHYDGEAYVRRAAWSATSTLPAAPSPSSAPASPSTASRISGRTRDASSPEKHARRPGCVFFGR